jgi:CDP-glucose 4,6-dehydratase
VKIRRPDAIRPWQHVLEPLSGYLLLAERLYADGPRCGGGWNFGPRDEDAKPVRWIVEQLTRLWGPEARWQIDGAEHPHEAHFLKLDCSHAHEALGWRPRLPLTDALGWIVQWHRAHATGGDMRERCQAQIDQFTSLHS